MPTRRRVQSTETRKENTEREMYSVDQSSAFKSHEANAARLLWNCLMAARLRNTNFIKNDKVRNVDTLSRDHYA